MKQPAEKDCVNDLNSLVMLELCKKLNIECAVGCDYRDLAAHFEMISDDIRLISQGKEQTQEVLKWVGRKPENTVAKLREKLVEMERDDCVAIIDKEYKCEVCLVYGSSVTNIYYYLSLRSNGDLSLHSLYMTVVSTLLPSGQKRMRVWEQGLGEGEGVYSVLCLVLIAEDF